jgi:hypothetical protein
LRVVFGPTRGDYHRDDQGETNPAGGLATQPFFAGFYLFDNMIFHMINISGRGGFQARQRASMQPAIAMREAAPHHQ